MSAQTTLKPDWIALEWGPSELRAYAMTANGIVLEDCTSKHSPPDFPQDGFAPALQALTDHWTLPTPCTVVVCGSGDMRQARDADTLRSVPCTPLPEKLTARAEHTNELHVWGIPGIKQSQPADIMHGEETKIAGFLALNSDWDGVICMPGPHSRWVHVSAGEIVSFQTFMTGELFAAISTHTALRDTLRGDDWDKDAFTQTLSAIQSRPERLASTLFSLRAANLLYGQDTATARAQLSGALIGAELASAKPYWLGQNIALIGEDHLTDLYSLALKQQGITARSCEASSAVCAGLTAAYATL